MNNTTAIKITNLSKQYRLGLVGTGTLSHDLKRWWTMNILGKDDPNLKIGEVNVRDKAGESDYVWALKDINIEIEQGEVIGIIGKNGAGKSTLLKILSRVTKPTTGQIQYRGRLGSLLEVGTGFHQEMTGRENIYMNGSIMGMTRHEITRKLDEIIFFAGVERYIDTPVKRYSSGMTVRLGFSVAAHLEPDILVVDEVLAIGDAEFQKKAIGKMQDVSEKGGRTVLFVSHDMSAIQKLTSKAIVLDSGIIGFSGDTFSAIKYYRKELNMEQIFHDISKQNGIYKISIETTFENNKHLFGQPLKITFHCRFKEKNVNSAIAFQLFNEFGYSVINPLITDNQFNWSSKGDCVIACLIETPRLYMGMYYISVHLGDRGTGEHIETLRDILSFEVVMDNKFSEYGWIPKACTYIEDVKWLAKNNSYDAKVF